MGIFASIAANLGSSAIYDAIRSAWQFIGLKKRQKLLFKNKIWRGTFTQRIEDGDDEVFDIAFTFDIKRRALTAIAQYTSAGEIRDLNAIGGFFDEHHIFLQYTSASETAY